MGIMWNYVMKNKAPLLHKKASTKLVFFAFLAMILSDGYS